MIDDILELMKYGVCIGFLVKTMYSMKEFKIIQKHKS